MTCLPVAQPLFYACGPSNWVTKVITTQARKCELGDLKGRLWQLCAVQGYSVMQMQPSWYWGWHTDLIQPSLQAEEKIRLAIAVSQPEAWTNAHAVEIQSAGGSAQGGPQWPVTHCSHPP